MAKETAKNDKRARRSEEDIRARARDDSEAFVAANIKPSKKASAKKGK